MLPREGLLPSMSDILWVWRLQAIYRRADKQVRHLQQRDKRHWVAARVAEFSQAWQRRSIHHTWRLGRLLSGRRIGPKRRHFDAPQRCRPSAQDWADYLAMPGPAGGCQASVLQWNVDTASFMPRLPTIEDTQLANEDVQQITRFLQKAGLRKSVPDWAVPVEVWRGLLRGPHGRGALPEDYVAQTFRRRLFQLCLCIRLRRQTPSTWHRSQTTEIDKRNGKPGCQGIRLINQLDPFGVQCYKHIWQRCSPRSYRHYASGYYACKSRISSIVQRHVLSHRLSTSGINHVESFFDVSNAFPSPTHA